MKGILLDVEQYGGTPFSYLSKAPNGSVRSLKEYQSQVRNCGQEFMRAINKAYPNITIMLTSGYSLGNDCKKYELLPSFLDGILAAASPSTVIIDGWEYSYGYISENQFRTARNTIYKQSTERADLPESARRHYLCSFGLWIDKGVLWSNSEIEKNYFSPETFLDSLRFAVKHSDRYVWVYSEKANWWNSTMPQAYLDALRKAHSP